MLCLIECIRAGLLPEPREMRKGQGGQAALQTLATDGGPFERRRTIRLCHLRLHHEAG